jgi:limonene-1,2-epoxide hydrolase
VSAADFGQQRIDTLFASIDGSDSEAFVSFLTEGASFRFGSADAVVGRANIAAGVDGFFASIAACNHHVAVTIADGDTVVCEGEVTYTRHDQTQVTLPFVDVLELAGDLIRDYKIYIDIGPLYAS